MKSKADRRRYHHGNLKAAITQRALNLLENENRGLTSLRELAKEFKVTHTAIYRHFKSKREIIASVAEEGFEKLKIIYEEVTKRGAGKPGLLKKLGIAHVTFAYRNPGYFKAMFHPDLRNKEDLPQLDRAAREAFGFLLAAIQEGIKEGEFQKLPIPNLVVLAWVMVHGLSTLLIDGQLDKQIREWGLKVPTLVPETLSLIETGILKTGRN